MKTFVALMCLVFVSLFTSKIAAQDSFGKFGDASIDELVMNSYKRDTNADAVVLRDIGKSVFVPDDNGFYLVFEVHARIKIFKKSGFENATILIPLQEYGKKGESLHDIRAVTYNLIDGRIKTTPLDPKTIYEERINDNLTVKKFTMPDLKEGSVIEYKYTVICPFLFNIPSWEFQHEIPTILSDYTLLMVPFYEYTYMLQGATRFDKFESFKDDGLTKSYGPIKYNDNVFHFVMNDVPAFKKEPFITSMEDYVIKIDFQLSKVTRTDGVSIDILDTWDKLGKDLIKDKDFGKYLKNSEDLARGLFDISKLKSADEMSRFLSVVKEVKGMVRWDGKNSKYANKPAKNFINEKTGNSAAVNLFLAGVLNASGIEAYPVLLSTSDNGKIKVDYPFLHCFNYVAVIAKVNEKWLLADATELFCPDAFIPPRCINGKGLIVFNDKTGWVDLPSRSVSQNTMEFTMEPIPAKDSINVTCNFVYTG